MQEKLWPTLLTTGWKFWPAVHLITYSLIPPRHRVLWINGVDLVWVTFLSRRSPARARRRPRWGGSRRSSSSGSEATACAVNVIATRVERRAAVFAHAH